METRNAAVAENFAWDEFFGAERNINLKDRMRASVKEVQKLSTNAKKAMGSAGGPSYGAARKRSRFCEEGRTGWIGRGRRSLFSPRLR